MTNTNTDNPVNHSGSTSDARGSGLATHPAYRFTTPYGREYFVTADGNIAYDGLTPSGQWKFIGLRELRATDKPGCTVIPFARLGAFLAGSPELCFKNGNPRYAVEDLDHGTRRMWGNTKYHGVRGMWAVSA